MRIDDVTSDTPCPDVLGGRRLHYPRTTAGEPVSMPYTESRPYGLEQRVMLSLCGDTYLRPPRDDGTDLACEVHEVCAHLHERAT